MSSLVLTLVMMLGFVEFSLAYVMLVTPFVIDSLVGMKKLKAAFSHDGEFSKPTISKEFVYASS
jgi:hypothetical protein